MRKHSEVLTIDAMDALGVILKNVIDGTVVRFDKHEALLGTDTPAADNAGSD